MERIEYEKVFKSIIKEKGWQDTVEAKYWDRTELIPRSSLSRKTHKISICSNVMDRLDNIRTTLEENIKANLDYPYVEHLVLDYNSKDGFVDWVKKDMKEYIRNGRLVVYRTTNPDSYSIDRKSVV